MHICCFVFSILVHVHLSNNNIKVFFFIWIQNLLRALAVPKKSILRKSQRLKRHQSSRKIKGWKIAITGKYRKWKFHIKLFMLLITFFCKQKWFVALLLFLQITFVYFTVFFPLRKYLSVSFLSFTIILYLY